MIVRHANNAFNVWFADLLTLQCSMSSMSRNRSNLIEINVFVRSSTIIGFVRMYFNRIFSFYRISRIQWYLMSMCLIRRWNSRFSLKAIVLWLFAHSTMRILSVICICNSKERNQIASFLVSLRATYFDSQIDCVTRSCCFKNHEIEFSLKKNIYSSMKRRSFLTST